MNHTIALIAQPTTVARRVLHSCRRVVLLAALLLGIGGLYTRAHAQVSVSLQSDPELVLDHNSPTTAGPRAAYVQFRFTNTTASSMSGVGVTLSGFANGITLSGGQAVTQYLPTLPPGASADLYWFITYPHTFGTSATLVATAVNLSNVIVGTGSGTLTTRSLIQANAGGSMVSQVLIGHAVGAITYIDVVYQFGGANPGERYIMEVAGYAAFRADCFQLVGTEVTASNVPAIPVGTINRKVFSATKAAGNNYSVTLRHSFRIQCLGTESSTSPYAVQGSGSDNLKYSGTFVNAGDPGTQPPGDGGGIVIPPPANPFTMTKAAGPDSLGAGGLATFTIVVNNTSTQAAAFDSIVDTLRAGLTFNAIDPSSEITSANSAAIPASGAAGRIVFRSIPGTGYSVPSGGTLTLVYTVNVQDVEGWYVNSATMFAGLSAAGSDTDSVRVRFPVVVGVTPDGVTPAVRRVPGGDWTQTFTVTNGTRRAGEAFDLLFTYDHTPSVVVQRDSITGPGIAAAIVGDSARIAAWPAETPYTYTVWYRMTPGDTGVQNVFELQARSVTYPVIADTGYVPVRRGAPLLTLVKAADVTDVLPGEDVSYTVTFSNIGTFDATETVVVDSIPSQLDYRIGSESFTLPAGVSGVVSYSNDHGVTWTYTPASGGCAAPGGYDRCVTRIRLVITGDIPPLGAGSGSLQFGARVR